MQWDVPVDIKSAVFGRLSLRQKLQCEAVCKDWLQLLRGWHPDSTRQLASAIWGKKLEVYVRPDKSDKIEISHRTTKEIKLALKPEIESTASRAALGRWLRRVSSVADIVEFTSAQAVMVAGSCHTY